MLENKFSHELRERLRDKTARVKFWNLHREATIRLRRAFFCRREEIVLQPK